ncbi:hypothetical protein RND81_04G235600 [Saponaria officinalis]|uniref:Response regulatory domain-containing protein n=1 Tax=Saponaria officinalis TaxID=3572 RepID=A0AAW1LRK7_SAPOF
MISASASNDIIMKGVRFGLVNYLIKPVRLEVLQTIWQHVYKKKFICSSTSPLIDRPVSPSNDRVEVCRGDNGTSEDDRKEDENVVTDGNDKEINYKEIQDSVETSKSSSKGEKRKSPIRGDEDNVESGNNPTEKKGRIKWIKERNDKFLLVVQTLGGIEKAVPKKILELMEDPDLTREQVASHLQKIRDNHKKKANLDQNTSHTSTNNSNINNNDNNNINDNNYYFNSPRLPAPSSMRPLVGTTPTHRPPLPNTMPPWGLLGPNYQIRPNNNHCWMGPPIGYRPQLLQQPQQQQPRMMMPSISNNYFETNPTPTMFQHIPQGSSFDSRLQQPPEEVFDHGPAMIDTTFDLSFSNIFDDIAPEYPSFDFPDDNKDQIHRL